MPYRILIVDDDADFREEFKEILEDYDVLEAASGREAIEIIKGPNIIDLVILDIKMPGLQGTEVLKQIKSLDPNIFVVMLTGYSHKDIILESLRGNADDFLEKPIKVEKTLKTIDRLLDRKLDEVSGAIEKIQFIIEKNYHKNISLKEAAEIVCLSPKYISKIFKDNTGIGFNAYKLRLKIRKARELLQQTDLNINEIAYQIGYKNVESFVRMFKQSEGATPTEYRQDLKADTPD